MREEVQINPEDAEVGPRCSGHSGHGDLRDDNVGQMIL